MLLSHHTSPWDTPWPSSNGDSKAGLCHWFSFTNTRYTRCVPTGCSMVQHWDMHGDMYGDAGAWHCFFPLAPGAGSLQAHRGLWPPHTAFGTGVSPAPQWAQLRFRQQAAAS